MEYKYLEHIADLKFEAKGKNLKEAFTNAAKAMFNSMVELKQIEPKIEEILEINSESLESLLFDWLSELLRVHDTNDLIFSEFTIQSIRRTESGWYLKAKFKGEKIDTKKHDIETQIKAMTYNDLKIEKTSKGFTLIVVMDI